MTSKWPAARPPTDGRAPPGNKRWSSAETGFAPPAEPAQPAEHSREINGITAGLEQRALQWLVARVPPWTTPDHMTALGLAGAIVCGIGMALGGGWLLLAALGLIVNWYGDSLDGTLARHRRIERPHYGFFIDQATDIVAQIAIVLGLGLSPYMRFDVACLALALYFLATAYTLIKLHTSHTKQLSYYGIGPTEVRLILLVGIAGAGMLGPKAVSDWLGPLGLFDLLALFLVLLALIGLAATARRDARELVQGAAPPLRNKGSG